MNSGWRSAIKTSPPWFTCHSKHFIMVGNDHAKKPAEIKARKNGGGGRWVCRRNSVLWLKLADTLKRKKKKSYEICKGIDYMSGAFRRRTQWWLWQWKQLFNYCSPRHVEYYIFQVLLFMICLLAGSLVKSMFLYYRWKVSLKSIDGLHHTPQPADILVVQFRLGKWLGKTFSKLQKSGARNKQDQEKMQKSWRIFWRVYVTKLQNDYWSFSSVVCQQEVA